ncbi:MAG: DNA-binding response regulator [Thalassobius sp.]|nr:DNA-binding response regulator [Thalassovita sp.]
MKVLIVEDENLACERLADLVKQYDEKIEIVGFCDTIKDTVDFFNRGREVDLVFMDIQLSDGKSFEIFEKIDLDTPVIFTTTYESYMLKAFKTNSIDYLLKPINYSELKIAIDKFKKLWQKKQQLVTANGEDFHDFSGFDYQKLLLAIGNKEEQYKKRFLVKVGDKFKFVTVENIGCFYAEGKVVYLLEKNNAKRYIIDYTLEELESAFLNPKRFYRINRKFIIHIDDIQEIRNYVNSRLKVFIDTPCNYDLIVSREKVLDFKNWIDG